jgi:hypothetical protein
MIGVFSIVATLSFLDFKEMGVGLASAVHHEPELCPSRLSVDVEREDARHPGGLHIAA